MTEKKRYSLNEVKEIVKTEADKVIKENELKVDFMLFTKEEYFASDLYTELANKYSEEYARNLFNDGGHCYDKTIVVFINRNTGCDYYNDTNISLALWKSFHEIRHIMQKDIQYCNSIFEYILVVVGNNIRKRDLKFYKKYYHDFFHEVDANVYGLNKTMDVLEKYPDIKSNSEKLLMKYKKIWDMIYQTYDYNIIFNKFYELVANNILEYDFLFDNTSNPKKFHNPNNIYDKFKEDELESAYKVLTSDAYLNNLDYDSLTSDKVEIMIDAIEKTSEDWINKDELLKQFLADYDDTKGPQYYFDFFTEKKIAIDKRFELLEEVLKVLKEKKKFKK